MTKSSDPIVRIADLRIIRDSAELEVELSERGNGGPTLHILQKLKERAAESLAGLAIVDPEDAKAIRALQNEVSKYDEWVVWMRELLAEGKALDDKMQDQEREELFDLLMQTEDGQREAVVLGLIDQVQTDA